MDLEAQLINLHAAKREERWGETLSLAESILTAVPDRFLAIDARALALSRLGRREEALAAYDHAVRVAEERLKKGLPAQDLVVSMRLRRAGELALCGRDADALADLKVAVELEPKCRAQLKKERALFARVLETEAGAALLAPPKKVRTAGVVVELTTRADDEVLRSHFFALGTPAEIIAVLAAEFGIPPADAGGRTAAAEAALTLDQSFVASVVRSAEADQPIDLHSFVEVFWNGAWHALDSEDLGALREKTFEELRALQLEFRIDEEALRSEIPENKRTPLKSGEVLQVDSFDAFDGEDKLLQHGVHDVVEGTFSPLPSA